MFIKNALKNTLKYWVGIQPNIVNKLYCLSSTDFRAEIPSILHDSASAFICVLHSEQRRFYIRHNTTVYRKNELPPFCIAGTQLRFV